MAPSRHSPVDTSTNNWFVLIIKSPAPLKLKLTPLPAAGVNPIAAAEVNVGHARLVAAIVLGVVPPIAPGAGNDVTFAEPLKLLPPIVRVVCSTVAVAALPVHDPDDPVTLPTTLPVSVPFISPKKTPVGETYENPLNTTLPLVAWVVEVSDRLPPEPVPPYTIVEVKLVADATPSVGVVKTGLSKNAKVLLAAPVVIVP